MAHAFFEALLVNSADLFEEDNGIASEAERLELVAVPDVNVGGELGLSGLAGDGGCDHGWAVAVADIVLNYQHRAKSALLRADDRA